MKHVRTKKRLSMIQSPRGQLNVTAPIGFHIETVEDYMNPDPNITSPQTLDTNNTDSLDQLVWSNPIQTKLHPQILRKIAFSDNLLHMAQLTKTPLGVNAFWEQGAAPSIEWKQGHKQGHTGAEQRNRVDTIRARTYQIGTSEHYLNCTSTH